MTLVETISLKFHYNFRHEVFSIYARINYIKNVRKSCSINEDNMLHDEWELSARRTVFLYFCTLIGQIYHVKAISAITMNEQPLSLYSSLIGVLSLVSLSSIGFKNGYKNNLIRLFRFSIFAITVVYPSRGNVSKQMAMLLFTNNLKKKATG